MSGGLPGLGLGGLFFIISALLAPLAEGVRALRGRSRPGAWRAVWRQFAIAVTMLIAIELTLQGALGFARVAGLTESGAGLVGAGALGAIGITTGLLALVLGGAKLAQLLCRPAGTDSEGEGRLLQTVNGSAGGSRRTLAKRAHIPRPAEANE